MSDAAPRSILFFCTNNSVRSPMAASLARRDLGGAARIESAGVAACETDPFAVIVLEELGLDLSGSQPRSISEVDAAGFDAVVCLSEEAHRAALHLKAPASAQIEFWSIDDPTIERDRGRSRDQILAAYRAVRDAIRARILARFADPGPQKSLDGA